MGLLLGLGTLAAPLGAQTQAVYGSFLAGTKSVNGNYLINEVGAGVTSLADGDSLAVHFQVYQQSPLVDFDFGTATVAISHPANETWSGVGPETLDIELWIGSQSLGPGTKLTSLSAPCSGIPAFNWEPPFGYWRTTYYFNNPGNVLQHGGEYWLVFRFTTGGNGHHLNIHDNAAGVPGAISTRSGTGPWSPSTTVTAQPAIKVKAYPKNEPCPTSAFMSAAIFGPPYSDTSYELHLELLCPPSTFQYYNCANVFVPASTSSYAAAALLVQAVQASSTCGSPSGTVFKAERSGNVVRVSHTGCPCSGAYVCSDPAGILSFAKTMGYQHEGVPMETSLQFGGLATGTSPDPLIPPGVQVIHQVLANPDGPVQTFAALFAPGAGATPSSVALGLEALLQAQGDVDVTAVGGTLRFEAPASTLPQQLLDEAFANAANWDLSTSGPGGVGWAVDASPALVIGQPSFQSAPFSLNFNNGQDIDGSLSLAVRAGPTGLTPAGPAGALAPSPSSLQPIVLIPGEIPGHAVSGTATTIPGLIPDLSTATGLVLSFACNYATQTEQTNVDQRFLEFSNNGFASANLGSLQLAGVGQSAGIDACAPMGTWHTHTVTTPQASWGSGVQLRFRFDSLDDQANTGAGWFLDDVSLAASQILVEGSYDVAYRINDGGLTWAFSPFVVPDPLALFDVSAPWADLGFSTPGVTGPTLLLGTGPLEAGSEGTLTLTNAAPSALAQLFASTTSTPIAFSCGVLVPFPAQTTTLHTTSILGQVPIEWVAWPAGFPSGSNLFYQYVIQDPAGCGGVSLSNAVRADLP